MTAQCSAVTARAVPAGVFARLPIALPMAAVVSIRGERFAFHRVAPTVHLPAWVIA